MEMTGLHGLDSNSQNKIAVTAEDLGGNKRGIHVVDLGLKTAVEGSKPVLVEELISGAMLVGTSAVLAAIGASNLVGRKSLGIYNNGDFTIYYGGLGVLTSTGIPIKKSSFVSLSVGDAVDIYLVSANPNIDVRLTEGK